MVRLVVRYLNNYPAVILEYYNYKKSENESSLDAGYHT